MRDGQGGFRFPGVAVEFGFDAASDRGAVRRVNEDAFVSAPPIFAVADGMGGHAFGDRASAAVAEAFGEAFSGEAPASAERVLDVIRDANRAVLELTVDAPDIVSGTTLSGIAFVSVGPRDNFHWMAFNVGDSRVYSWDGRALVQLTVDHSAVQELVDGGIISRRDAATHRDRNIVTRALGADQHVDPDIWLLPASGHQRFLVCSDGLTKELSDEEIARIIVFHSAASSGDEAEMTLSQRLVGAAIAAGGSDNVTVVSVESRVSGPIASDDDRPGDDTVERSGLSRELEDTSPRR